MLYDIYIMRALTESTDLIQTTLLLFVLFYIFILILICRKLLFNIINFINYIKIKTQFIIHFIFKKIGLQIHT